jgi:hypothetical protein
VIAWHLVSCGIVPTQQIRSGRSSKMLERGFASCWRTSKKPSFAPHGQKGLQIRRARATHHAVRWSSPPAALRGGPPRWPKSPKLPPAAQGPTLKALVPHTSLQVQMPIRATTAIRSPKKAVCTCVSGAFASGKTPRTPAVALVQSASIPPVRRLEAGIPGRDAGGLRSHAPGSSLTAPPLGCSSLTAQTSPEVAACQLGLRRTVCWWPGVCRHSNKAELFFFGKGCKVVRISGVTETRGRSGLRGGGGMALWESWQGEGPVFVSKKKRWFRT